jgi:hypothetical protein
MNSNETRGDAPVGEPGESLAEFCQRMEKALMGPMERVAATCNCACPYCRPDMPHCLGIYCGRVI